MSGFDNTSVDLWLLNLDVDRDEDCLDACRSVLDESELAQIARFVFAKHSHRYLLTRAAVRHILSDYQPRTAAGDWRFDRNLHGKPGILAPEVSEPLFFNLSHSAGRLVVAVSRAVPLGVDVECIEPRRDFLEIARRRFAEDEASLLCDMAPDKIKSHFYELWTLKEAYIKAVGRGLALPLRSFSVGLDEESIISLRGDVERGSEDWRLLLFADRPDYRIGLAVPGQSASGLRDLRIRKLEDPMQVSAAQPLELDLLRQTRSG